MAPDDQRSRGGRSSTARLVSGTEPGGKQYRLRSRRVVIGTDPKCDIVIEDPSVSRRHAMIVRDQHGFLLSDLDSTNGTFLGESRVSASVRLTPGDRIRLGAASFTFLAPTPATRRTGRLLRRLAAIAVVVAIIGLAGTAYYFAGTSRETPPVATQRRGEPGWLARLNHYRMLAKLYPVAEDPALSHADALHARYVVGNYAAQIRSGHAGAFLHTERPGNPFFTPQGRDAARLSDVTFEFTSPPLAPGPGWAIDNWIGAPFHRLPILNPELVRVGFGQFCQGGLCAAALNVRSGIVRHAHGTGLQAVMFPAARSTIGNGTFAADDGEWPSPFTPCPGYSKPTGLPITLQLGRDITAVLQHYSLSNDGTALEACGYDARSYRNPDALAATMGRRALSHFGAIVIIPRKPLLAGHTYRVSATVSGTQYGWWFRIAP